MEKEKKLQIKHKTGESWPRTCPKLLLEIVPQIHYSDKKSISQTSVPWNTSPKKDDM